MILDILKTVGECISSGQNMQKSMAESDRRKNEAISKSNSDTMGKVAGIAALGALAAFGINQLADNKKGNGNVDKAK